MIQSSSSSRSDASLRPRRARPRPGFRPVPARRPPPLSSRSVVRFPRPRPQRTSTHPGGAFGIPDLFSRPRLSQPRPAFARRPRNPPSLTAPPRLLPREPPFGCPIRTHPLPAPPPARGGGAVAAISASRSPARRAARIRSASRSFTAAEPPRRGPGMIGGRGGIPPRRPSRVTPLSSARWRNVGSPVGPSPLESRRTERRAAWRSEPPRYRTSFRRV